MTSRLVLGIDLGTSNSVGAIHWEDGHWSVVSDAHDKTIQPSVLSFHPNGSVLVASAARKRRLVDPKNTIYSAKRLIGRPFSSRQVQEIIPRLSYRVTEGPAQQVMVSVRNHLLSVSQVSALILQHIEKLADKVAGQHVPQVVVTVPANFNEAQRAATRQAARLAGLDVLRIINEPTAAALAYGHGMDESKTILVYDLGGGTFDVTVLRVSRGIFEVLGTAGDTHLGGDDLDERLTEAMVEAFMQQHHYDLNMNEMAILRLRSVAEKAKCTLSDKESLAVHVRELAYGPGGISLDLEYRATRDRLEGLVADLVERTIGICDEAMTLAQLRTDAVDEIVLVGGMTRMPLVQRSVTSFFSRKPVTSINPDEVVAVGAAIQGASLLGTLPASQGHVPSLLLDVTPRTLAVATVGGFCQILIPRNAQIPTEHTRTFTTGADYQTAVTIRVCQGEHRRFEKNVMLGELRLEGLRPAPRGEVRIAVTFEIDSDGLLKVSARDQDSGEIQSAAMRVVAVDEDNDSAWGTDGQPPLVDEDILGQLPDDEGTRS
ncbi:MAG: Hsp70 family protein [Deltaproteobacteria bacterium]|nr:Hsp70 family protein [Deltaproteobacteria bacterium]